jgi:hypothetical protein
MSVRHEIALTLALAVAAPALALETNGPGAPAADAATRAVTDAATRAATENLTLGAIQSLSVSGCVLSFALQVTADAGGGTDTFALQVWDESVLVREAQLAVPADGAVHNVAGTIHLPPISQTKAGIGVYLVDGPILDVEDPFAATCVPFEIPAASRAGIASLGLLLTAAALFALRRRGRN